MKFGPVPVEDAEGAVLAHTARLGGRVLAKGSVLDAAAQAALRRAGWQDVVVARLETGDVGENEAAGRLAAALARPGLSCVSAGTGRVNLAAAAAGLFRADAARVDALNALDEGLTLGTLPDATPVSAGELVATIKVIPFAVPGAAVAAAERLARAVPAVRFAPFRPLRVGLVLSTLPGLKDSVIEGTIRVTGTRVQALGGRLLPPLRCAHTEDAVSAALAALCADGAQLLLFAGASAVVDRADVGPAAIVSSGGTLEHLGMPVDPGNLICLGQIGAVPAVVLPGCARSPKLNGIDLVLRRIFAGEPAGRVAVTAMGVGGLLKDTPGRPAARSPQAKRPPRVAAVVLAAGASTRMAPRNKLLLEDGAGLAMAARVAAACAASRADEVIVVTGHQAEAVEAAVRHAAPAARFVRAAAYAEGLSASLRAGVSALGADVTAALICLGDMPLVSPAEMDQVIAAWCPEEERLIIVPTHRGKRGNPVLWDRRFFAEMAALQGDTGARGLFRLHADVVGEVELAGEAVLMDFDTPESLEGKQGLLF